VVSTRSGPSALTRRSSGSHPVSRIGYANDWHSGLRP
jgi:hypothetical protein